VAISAIPHDVRLIASVSRLLDLHQSRRSGGVYVPEVPDRAGYFLTIGLMLLDALREIELERGTGYVAIGEVGNRVKNIVGSAGDGDIEYCLATLAQQREIHYGAPDGHGGIAYGHTRNTTPLVEIADGYAQVQLSENGRMLLRVSSSKESWLYSDLDAERLVKALERGQFHDIPRFCREMISDLASKGLQLTQVMERPALSQLRDMLILEGSRIAGALHSAIEVVKNAMTLVFDHRTQVAFDEWKGREGAQFQLGNLQAELELVVQTVEKISRKFIRFLDQAQRVRHEGAEQIKFLDIADHLVRTCNPSTKDRLDALCADILPAGISNRFFHPSLLVNSIDFRDLMKESGQMPVMAEYDCAPESTGPQERFQSFVLRHREYLLERLRRGPLFFQDLLGTEDVDLTDGESMIDFFGAYTAPETLDHDGFEIVVGLTKEKFERVVGDMRIVSSNPMIILKKATS